LKILLTKAREFDNIKTDDLIRELLLGVEVEASKGITPDVIGETDIKVTFRK
jgi:hypothetical protein